MIQLDHIDKKILSVLSEDARLSVEKVAERVSLSATPVRRRIKRLETEGLIGAYTLKIDMLKAGYGLQLYVFLKLQSRDKQTIAEFEAKIQSLPKIATCALVTGPHDYIVTLWVQDMEEYNEFLRSVLSELPGVFGLETSIVIGRIKDQQPYIG